MTLLRIPVLEADRDASGGAGVMQIPQETLYKKNVLVVRGRFCPFTLLHNDMLLGAASQFFCDDTGKQLTASFDDECVFREDTLVRKRRARVASADLTQLVGCSLCVDGQLTDLSALCA